MVVNIKAFEGSYRRWLKRSILEVFSTEFRDRSRDYYEYAITKGLITINDRKVPTDTLIRNQDVIAHNIHRHEPPVTGHPIRIVSKEEEVVVIDKPGSVPAFVALTGNQSESNFVFQPQVHPSGRYRHNTVLHILQKEHGLPKLYPVNRLDRLTSGLMLLALNSNKAQQFEQQMKGRNIRKEYVCRVLGEFP
ncbi:pseudouridine synthase, partial [Jimgerdemannia flammicorona]